MDHRDPHGGALLECRGVTFGYGAREPVLGGDGGLDLAVAPGAFVLVEGPSGSGKSTLLRLFARLETPASGQVRFRGRPLDQWDPPELRRRVVLLQQTPALVDGSVRENLLLPFSFRANADRTPPGDEELAGRLHDFLLSGVGLEDDALALSVGQRQRLALIRALLLRPEALLMDEPTSALDPESAQVVEQRAEALNLERGLTVVMVSHRGYGPQRVSPVRLRVAGGAAQGAP
jgi:putative ABC transport system ATP-binding protein